MKTAFATAFAVLFLTATAHAEEAYPAYTKDKSAWWVSAIFLGPVVGLDAVGRAIEVSGKDQGAFKPLHKATAGIAKSAAGGLCGAPAVGTICK
jgi:hypothetical protein